MCRCRARWTAWPPRPATRGAQPGGDLIAWGGATFAHALIAANTIDEYRLVVNPMLAGEGLRIFRPFPGPIDLRLTDVQSFATGAVLHVYDRLHRARQ